MKESYIIKRNSKEFNILLKKLEIGGIFFTENENNGIFTYRGVSHTISKNMLYRESGVSHVWKNVGKGRDAHEDFLPISDDEFYNVYIRSILSKVFSVESV